MKSWLGYLISGFLVVFALAVGTIALTSAQSTMRGMQRVAMPGRVDIMLPLGPSTLYAEPAEIGAHCTLADPRVELRAVSSAVRYDLAGFTGRSIYDATAREGGRYAITCEAARAFTLAIGAGVGSWVVVVAIAGVPMLIGLGFLAATFVRRRSLRG